MGLKSSNGTMNRGKKIPLRARSSTWATCKPMFRSAADANAYYALHNPFPRPITALGGLHSDWDPNTRLRYVIREMKGEAMTVEPFSPDNKPAIANGAVTCDPTT